MTERVMLVYAWGFWTVLTCAGVSLLTFAVGYTVWMFKGKPLETTKAERIHRSYEA